MRDKPIVSIHCLVYNHELYLRQCLDGFVMQKTDFAFEAIVHDDCSTDGSAAIIREYAEKYPEIIKPIYETENQFSKIGFSGINSIMIAHSNGKYVALCEGDDYWIDPLKLQKQVNYMEEHPECGLIHTLAKVYKQNDSIFIDGWSKCGQFDELLFNNFVVTPTACFRKDLYLRFISEIGFNNGWKMGDYPLWLFISKYSRVILLPDVTSVYRQLDESASHSKDVNKQISFLESGFCVQEFYAVKYGRKEVLKQILFRDVNYLIDLCINNNHSPNYFFIRKMFKHKITGPNMYIKHLMLYYNFSRHLLKKYIRYKYQPLS